MNDKDHVISRALSCIRQRRLPDTLLALRESFAEKYGPRYYRRLQARAQRRTGGAPSQSALRALCETALEDGAALSMQDITYGPAHWEQSNVLATAPRY